MRRAIIINFISRYAVVLVNLIMNFILARLISPQEFGVVAIITVFTSFFTLLSDVGIGPAVIQYKELKQKDHESLYSVTFYIGILLSIAFLAVGVLVAFVYHNKVYIPLSGILTISILFNSLNMVPNALLYKEQRFMEIGVRTLATGIVSGGITVILAVIGFSYYAVVINSVLQAVLVFVWNHIRIRLRFRFRFNTGVIKKVFGFSVYQMLFNITNYFVGNTDTLLIGLRMGEEKIGLYDKAYRLITYPMSMISGIVTPVLHPVLSNYRDDKDVLYDYLMRIFRLLFYTSLFVSGVCFFASDEIIRVLYGKDWEMASGAFRLLSLSIVTKMCNAITGAFFQSLGETRLLFKTGVVSGVFIIGFTLIGVWQGSIEGVSMAVSLGYMINFWIAYYYLVKKGFKMDYPVFVKSVIKPYVIYGSCIGLVSLITMEIENIFISLTAKVLVVLAIYVFLLLVFGEMANVKDAYRLFVKKRDK